MPFKLNPLYGKLDLVGSGGSATGPANTIAAFNGSGNLTNAPGWNVDDNGQVGSFLSGTLPTTSVTSIQFFPTITTSLSGGYEGVISGGSFTSSMIFMSSFNAENEFDAGFNNSGGTNLFNDQSIVDPGAISNSYSSFSSFPTLNGTITNFGAYVTGAVSAGTSFNSFTGFGTSPTLNSGFINSGGTIGFSDGANLNSGATTSYYTSIQLSPNLHLGSTTGSIQGITYGPNIDGTVTGSFKALDISPSATVPVGGDVRGINISLNQMQGNDPQGVLGVESDSRISIGAVTKLASAQTFQIGSRVAHQYAIPIGSPVTGTDSIGVDISGDLNAQDNLAIGPIGLGFSSIGSVMDLAIANTKTVAAATVMLAAIALPDPGYTTGGSITDVHVFRVPAPLPEGGTVNITNLYAFKLDSIFGAFSSAATNAYGIYLDDSGIRNWMGGRTLLGGSTFSLPTTVVKIVGDLTVENILPNDTGGESIIATVTGHTTVDSSDTIIAVNSNATAVVDVGATNDKLLAGTVNTVTRGNGTDQGTLSDIAGDQNLIFHNSDAAGTTDEVVGFHNLVFTIGGTITNLYDFKSERIPAGSGVVTNHYGIYVDADTTTPVQNWLSGNTLIGGSSFTAPLDNLNIKGSIAYTTNTVSTTYTVDSGSDKDTIIFANTSGAAFTITLPTPTNGRKLTFKDSTGSFTTNNLTLDPGAAKIDTVSGTQLYSVNFMSIDLISNGTDWFII